MEMTSNCDVTNSAHQKQITAIWPWTKPPPWKFSAYATGLKWMTVSILLFWGWELVSVITVCGTKRLNPFSGFYEASELNQARNQFGTPGGAKSFLRGAQIFELSPTHFPRGEKKFYWGISPPWLRACNKCVMWVWSNYFTAAFFVSFTVTVFVPDSAVVAQLCPPEMPTGTPQWWFLKKYFDNAAHPEAKWPLQQNYFFVILFHYFLVPFADTISTEPSPEIFSSI